MKNYKILTESLLFVDKRKVVKKKWREDEIEGKIDVVLSSV